MKYKFLHLSPGYLGNNKSELTLNSTFFGLLLNEKNRLSRSRVVFPQRVQKPDFFSEICSLESSNFEKSFKKIIKNFDSKLVEITKSNEYPVIELFNWINLSLRYARLDTILKIKVNLIDINHIVEFAFLKLIAQIQKNIVAGKTWPTLKMINLFQMIINSSKISDRLQILIYNILIVYKFRFHANLDNQIISSCYSKLLSLVEKMEENECIENQIRISVAFRGMAMINFLENKTRELYLTKAENIARSLRSADVLLRLLIDDNLFTCIQSQAKWNIQNKNYFLAKKYLKELIKIDPFDSVGHAELGFFYLNMENYEKARNCFNRSFLLGPPGVGMHIYYYAKCLNVLGYINKSKKWLQKAYEADKQSVNPLLDLIELYEEQNEIKKAKDLARNILDMAGLRSLLYKHEIKWLNNILGIEDGC